jgi:hypothetical protein
MLHFRYSRVSTIGQTIGETGYDPYDGYESSHSFEFPPSVEILGNIYGGAYSGFESSGTFSCLNVKSITLAPGSKLTCLAGFACFEIDSIDLPESLQEIEEHGFWYVELGRISFGENPQLRVISGFSGATGTEITILDSVAEISKLGLCASRLKGINFGEHSKLKKIKGFHFCSIKEIELPESIEVIDDEAFVHCHELTVVRIRENPNIRRFSGTRPRRDHLRLRGRKGRMIEFRRDAAISRFPTLRFGKTITQYLGEEKDEQYAYFSGDDPPDKQQSTFIRYSELSLKRFRGEFEWTNANPESNSRKEKHPYAYDNEADDEEHQDDSDHYDRELEDDSDDDDW